MHPLTSFSLFTIPLTLPGKVAMAFGIKPEGITDINNFIWDYTLKVTILLPVISVMFAFLMLKVVSGKEADKRHWIAALIAGLVAFWFCSGYQHFQDSSC